MKSFVLRLELAMLQGAALASLAAVGCAGRAEQKVHGEPTSGGAAADPDSDAREPYSAESVACSGTDYGDTGFGFHGQCCTEAACYTPDNGECAASDGAESALGLSLGSGQCGCGEVQGPFAPNPDDTPTSAGSCCYLVPIISCDGRALLVDGRAVVAPVMPRRDWLAGALQQVLA